MAGRTHGKHTRLYVDGYDLSSMAASVGTLSTVFEAETEAALSDSIKHVMGGLGQSDVMVGPITGWLDNTATTGLHTLHAAPGSMVVLTYAIGDRTTPAAGDPVFTGQWYTNDYMVNADLGGTAVPATLSLGQRAATAESLLYPQSWGNLLHAHGAETAVNSGTADHDYGASSALGGFGVLHLTAGNGTATFTIEHSATNSDAAFDSTGAIVTFDTTAAASPFAEVKSIGTTATVQRYLRWQVAFGTATSVTFAMAFVRGQ